MQELIILSSGRNGSNFLLSQLAASQEIYPIGEVFKSGVTGTEYNYFISKKNKECLTEQEKVNLVEYIDNALSSKGLDALFWIKKAAHLGPLSKKGIAYKLFVEHLFSVFEPCNDSIQVLLSFLEGSGQILLLYRERLIDIFLSSMRASSEDRWIDSCYTNLTVDADKQSYLDWRDWYIKTWALSLGIINDCYSFLADKPMLIIPYEDLASSDITRSATILSRFVFASEPTNTWLSDIKYEVTTKQVSPNGQMSLPSWAQDFHNDSFKSIIGECYPHLLYLLESNQGLLRK